MRRAAFFAFCPFFAAAWSDQVLRTRQRVQDDELLAQGKRQKLRSKSRPSVGGVLYRVDAGDEGVGSQT